MAQFKVVGPEAKARLVSGGSTSPIVIFANQVLDALVGTEKVLSVQDENVSNRGLKVVLSRQAKLRNVSLAYGEADNGALLVAIG